MTEGLRVVAEANGWPLSERTGELLVSAARGAMARDELDLAESLARSARHVSGGWLADLVLGEVLVKRGRYGEAARVLPGPPPSGTSVGQRTRWAVTAAEVVYLTRGDVEAAARVLGVVGGSVAGAHRAWILLLAGRCRAALAVGEDVLHGRSGHPEAVVLAAAAVTVAAGLLGQVERASTAYERGREAARRGGDPLTRTRLGYAGCLALVLAGRLSDASMLAGEGYRDALRAGAAAVAGGWSALQGVIARFRGDISSAVGSCREAIDLLDGQDVGRVLSPCTAELGAVLAMSGDWTGAEATLWRVHLRRPRAGCLVDAWVELARAWAKAAAGDTSSGARQARHAATLAGAGEQLVVEAIALYDAARLGDPDSVRGRLTEVADRVRIPMVRVMARAACALAHADPHALDQSTVTFTELGLTLLAAETATAAVALHRRAGNDRLADQSMRHAAEAARRCPGAATPLLLLAEPLVGLTGRERDVTLLAAAGLTSSAIAHRLRLSVRTVDNYLGRVYLKLGVAGRRDLPQVSAMGPTAAPFSIHAAPMSASRASALCR